MFYFNMLYYELVNDNTIYNGLNSKIIKWHISDAAVLSTYVDCDILLVATS